MIDLRSFTFEQVAAALLEELPHSDRGELRERALSLITIAEQAPVPIEELLQWIHEPAPEKEYSLREWRAYCQQRPVQGALFHQAERPAPDAFDPRPKR
jgi:uncharacterized Zn finger protein